MIIFNVGDGRNTRIQLDVTGVENAHRSGELPIGSANSRTNVFNKSYCRYQMRERPDGNWVLQDKVNFVPEILAGQSFQIRLNQIATLKPELSDGNLFRNGAPGALELLLGSNGPVVISELEEFKVHLDLSDLNSEFQHVFQVNGLVEDISPRYQASVRATEYNWEINATIHLSDGTGPIYIKIDPLVKISTGG